jgi:hypothetical protein
MAPNVCKPAFRFSFDYQLDHILRLVCPGCDVDEKKSSLFANGNQKSEPSIVNRGEWTGAIATLPLRLLPPYFLLLLLPALFIPDF